MGNKANRIKHLIWIDPNIDNDENQNYLKSMKESLSNIECFKTTDEGINYIKKIRFESSKIILSGRLYFEFIKKFKENIKNLYLIPKIAVFTGNKKNFLEYNKNNKENMNIINDPFYNIGKINESYKEIKEFLFLQKSNEKFIKKKSIIKKKEYDTPLTFEYIDCLDKLELPLLYQSIINITKIDKIENYNEYLYLNYAKEDNQIEILLNDIYKVPKIPIELLCKYYIRLYTMESNFYKNINYDLRNGAKQNNLSFIKILYEGLKLTVLELASNKELYRVSKISTKEIKNIKEILNNKESNLPGVIVFSKSFLSFSKDIKIAKKFFSEDINNNLSNVLYILEKDDEIDYNSSTHSDIEKISFYNEKEVLFFPFSCFEIKQINEKNEDNKTFYEIK